MSRLPPGVSWLLRVGLPADQQEPITGDLEEEFRTRLRAEHRTRATLAIWWQALRVALTFRWERLAHGRPLPPIGDERPRRFSVMERFAQDGLFAVRLLRRQPAFTLIAILMLALGIGANTALFSIVDSVLWRPLPFPDSGRLMSLAEQRPLQNVVYGPVAPADFFDWRGDTHAFSAVAAVMETAMNITGSGEPERLRGLAVSPAFLDALQVFPAQGRTFRNEEEMFGRHRVVIVTDAFWRRRLGAQSGIVGGNLTFDGNVYEIVGVMPPAFWWPSQPDVLVPLALDDDDRRLRGAHFLEVVARLSVGVSEDRARQELSILGAQLATQYPAENTGHAPNMRPLRQALVGDARTSLLVLLGAVCFVLLIACANVATLLLARASGRRKELSIRAAIGASRARLVQQMVTEALVLSVAAGAAGLLLAAWILSIFRATLPVRFSELPGLTSVGIDWRVLAAALAFSLFTGLVFGVIPALMASDQRAGVALNEESRSAAGSAGTKRLRSALVVVELAVSLVLLVGATLLLVSFNELSDVQLGFQPEQVVTVRLTLPGARYGDHNRALGFYEEVLSRLRTAPGVVGAAASSSPPFTGVDARLDLDIEHSSPAESAAPIRAHPRLVSADYFATMSIPLVRGRRFTDRDDESAPAVVVINETAARRYWPGTDPLGQRISLGDPQRWREIVGIVGDTRHQGLDTDSEPEAYIPNRQTFVALGTALERAQMLLVRTTSDFPTSVSVIRSVIKAVDRDQAIGQIQPMTTLIAESVAPRRFNFVLASAFAVVALLLTAAGVYGVMAYLVTQRTREIGVRMALGATSWQVVGMVMREGGTLIVTGIAIGIGGALLLTQTMTSMLFGVSAADPATYIGMSLLLLTVALLAVAIPSARAARVDPIVALREP